MADTVAKQSSGKKWMVIVLAIVIAGVVSTFLIFNYTYSEGSRAGVLIKFSKKGYVFKTYEGELNIGGMGNIPNTAQVNSIWAFSVRDNATADILMKLEGKQLSLHYQQIIKNMVWDGETDYFVDGVKVIE
jgi:hypothetical protein